MERERERREERDAAFSVETRVSFTFLFLATERIISGYMNYMYNDGNLVEICF